MNSRLWWMVFASGIAFGMAILLLIMIVAGRLPAEPAELPADPCQRALACWPKGDNDNERDRIDGRTTNATQWAV